MFDFFKGRFTKAVEKVIEESKTGNETNPKKTESEVNKLKEFYNFLKDAQSKDENGWFYIDSGEDYPLVKGSALYFNDRMDHFSVCLFNDNPRNSIRYIPRDITVWKSCDKDKEYGLFDVIYREGGRLISHDEYDELLSRRKEKYIEEFHNKDLSGCWFFYGDPNDFMEEPHNDSLTESMYFAKVVAKTTSEEGYCKVHYNVVDTIHDSNKEIVMPPLEYSIFCDIFSREMPNIKIDMVEDVETE